MDLSILSDTATGTTKKLSTNTQKNSASYSSEDAPIFALDAKPDDSQSALDSNDVPQGPNEAAIRGTAQSADALRSLSRPTPAFPI